MTAVRVLISGRVQGVNFRWYTVEEGNRLGVHGWVRNLRDGRVEAVVEGEPLAVDRMIEWMRRGPPGARVDEVVVEPIPLAGVEGFRITW